MNYHIDNVLILDNFQKDCECPMCEIEKELDILATDSFLNEAVMIDEYRDLVNKFGFCDKHFSKLFKGTNKLGTALQSSTRLKFVRSNLKVIKNSKQAKILAQSLHFINNSCAICDIIENTMNRYAETIASLYHKDESFKKHFLNGKGFCMKHYEMLLKNSGKAKSSEKEYLTSLSTLQMEQLERLQKELDWFCDKFDYRNKDKPFGTSSDALKRTILKLRQDSEI